MRSPLISGAEALRTRQAAPSSRQLVGREAPCVDVDQLLLKWMSVWGTWEWRDDRELLQGIVNRFQPRSPRLKGKSPRDAAGLGKFANKLR